LTPLSSGFQQTLFIFPAHVDTQVARLNIQDFKHSIIPGNTVKTGKFRMELSSILTLLGSGHQKPAWNLPVPNVQ